MLGEDVRSLLCQSGEEAGVRLRIGRRDPFQRMQLSYPPGELVNELDAFSFITSLRDAHILKGQIGFHSVTHRNERTDEGMNAHVRIILKPRQVLCFLHEKIAQVGSNISEVGQSSKDVDRLTQSWHANNLSVIRTFQQLHANVNDDPEETFV